MKRIHAILMATRCRAGADTAERLRCAIAAHVPSAEGCEVRLAEISLDPRSPRPEV